VATLKASRTEANLQVAFATETLAGRRYLAYAAQAEAEGNSSIAALFRAIADRRSSHAQRHMDVLAPCGDQAAGQSTGTAYNVRATIMHEVHDRSGLYSGMARKAREEGLEDISTWFEILAKASRSHAAFGGHLKPCCDRTRF
jgi:rubrerythrin